MRLGSVVIDSANSEELADFYQKLLGWTKETQQFDGEKWIIVKNPDGRETPLVFQEIPEYEKPIWPEIAGCQQQMLHLDFYIAHDELAVQVERAVALGATKAATQYTDLFTVMLDPAGHPFCLIPIPEEYEVGITG